MKDLRVIVDTNIFFMAFYNPESKAGLVMKAAEDEKLKMAAPTTVLEELFRLLKRKYPLSDFVVDQLIKSLPVDWYPEETYLVSMERAKIMPHEPDRPLVALAMLLNCGVITANYNDFKHVKKTIKVWDIDELLKEINS